MLIAVVHPNIEEAAWIMRALRTEGYSAAHYADTREFLKGIKRDSHDLVMISDTASHLALSKLPMLIRSRLQPHTPLLLVGHNHDEDAVAASLGGGADGYIALPISSALFSARVTALLRRVYPIRAARQTFMVGPYELNQREYRIKLHGADIPLSHTEARLAIFLFCNVGRVLSRSHLFALVWRRQSLDLTRTIDRYVSRLRAKLKLHPANGMRIRAIYSMGYRLELAQKMDYLPLIKAAA
ncbi:response regulator transcription factor [Ralstonia syzygii]|uniref:Putative two-component system response regulator, transcription regulator protein n=1 Tax=Ralstonia syzygii R24 TaxID=907261 RepID=G3A868_9RALS|nr:response regulator transcription factor [Ralstonia syzygii]CCA86189.1 putative two-component system response regulator, transcription regulator protein [Ralstonia syzygii R24]